MRAMLYNVNASTHADGTNNVLRKPFGSGQGVTLHPPARINFHGYSQPMKGWPRRWNAAWGKVTRFPARPHIPMLADDDSGSGSWLDSFGDLLKSAGSAYKDYTQGQAQLDAAKIQQQRQAAQLNAQRSALSFGPLTGGGMLSGSTFGIPNGVLLLGVGGLLAYKLMKRR